MSLRFPATWCATDLGVHRPSHGTYERYPYEGLPALDASAFTGSFAWFGDLGPIVDEQVAVMNLFAAGLAQYGLALPRDFVTFQTHAKLSRMLDKVSVTCCWSSLSRPMASPVEPGAYLVRFLRDQQDCAFWYLYLRPSAEAFVVHSYELAEHLDYLEPDEGFGSDDEDPPELDPVDLATKIYWCAPSFEQFAYRFWIENRIWTKLHGDPAVGLAPAERQYMDHYNIP
ncbi:hypothetical protein [Actinomadura macrotermitis]|uniref:Uncharacterized protein n=1 Tax=Actinomadura macrotermitis TaxID=2585200 RepID=A0A7K0C1L4_9ACTN|nr:hypothetical protein [Actinomadura macrotermitis]MQY07290.1 hypothetical protein [Actinomadura macrotermitis]